MSQSHTEHKVLLQFEADTKKVKVGIDQVSKYAKKLEKQTIAVQKNEVKQNKAIRKETEVLKKLQKIEAPNLKMKNSALQSQTKQMAAQTKELQKQHSWLTKIRNLANRPGPGGRGPGGPLPGGPGGPGGGGGAGPGGRGGRPGRWGFSNTRMGGFLRGVGTGLLGAGALVGGSLISMPFAAVSSDYQAYVSYMRGMASLSGLAQGMPFGAGATIGRMEGTDPGTVNAMVKNMAKHGYMPDEVSRAVSAFGRATGNASDTEYGLVAARGLGMDPGAIAQIFTEMRRGSGTFGAQGKRDFQKTLEAGVKSGVNASTLPEYLEGVTSLTARAGSGLGGSVSTLPYAQLLSLFQKSGFAGLQGVRGASVAGALEDAIKRPGGGAEGNAIMMAAIGGFGRVGGMNSYYQAKKAMQMGFQGPEGAGVVKKLFDYADHIAGGGQEANLLLEGITGGKLTLDQIETVRKALGEGKTESELQRMLEQMTASELDVLKKIEKNTSARGFLQAGEHAAEILNRNIMRGAKYKDPIEKIQKIMQDFIDAMSPLIERTLDTTAALLEDLTPAIKNLNKFMERHFATDEDATAARRPGYRELVEANDAISQLSQATIAQRENDPNAANMLEEARKSGLRELNDVLDFVATASPTADINEFLHGRVSRASVGYGYTESQRESMFNMSAENRALRQSLFNLLDLLRDGRDIRGIEGRVDTAEEASAVLRSLGININAGDRARTDSSGGSR